MPQSNKRCSKRGGSEFSSAKRRIEIWSVFNYSQDATSEETFFLRQIDRLNESYPREAVARVTHL